MNKQLNILFFSIEAVGHMNACVGIAQVLQNAGHKIQFLVSDQWKGRLMKYGIEEVAIPMRNRKADVDPTTFWSDLLKKGGALECLPPLEVSKVIWTKVAPVFIEEYKQIDEELERLFKELKPDILFVDQTTTFASVERSGIPWVNSCSFQPLFLIDDERTPPPGSGLSAYGNKKEWEEYRTALNEAMEPITDDYCQYLVSRGVPPLKKYKLLRDSEFLNIYGFPLELDYLDVRPLPPNWYRFDNLKRTESEVDFQVPEELQNKSGKLVYFSLGTMGCGDLDMLQRLIGIMGESQHRFIVSKGPHHQKLHLPNNMWGQPSVPQLQVLSVVDLFITHGGNNSLTESFFFGKPMIVMPIFNDQHDNAQRVQELGFGLKLNPHKCTKEELLGGIEKILNDKELNEKLKNISKRIQTENSIAKLPELIEQRLQEWNNRIE